MVAKFAELEKITTKVFSITIPLSWRDCHATIAAFLFANFGVSRVFE